MAKKQEEQYIAPAVISALFPGIGQIMKKEVAKGVAIIFGFAFSVLLIFLVIGLITTPILWIWQVYDAYNTQPEEE